MRSTEAILIGAGGRRGGRGAGVRRGAVARMAGVSDATLSAYETGIVIPPSDVLIRLAYAIKLNLKHLTETIGRLRRDRAAA